jgi:hypothetical protein
MQSTKKCENCSSIQLLRKCENCTLVVCPKCFINCDNCRTRYCIFCADDICWSFEKEEYIVFEDDTMSVIHTQPNHNSFMRTYVKYTVCCNK